MPLLQREETLLSELSLWIYDLRGLFSGKLMGNQQWTDLDLP